MPALKAVVSFGVAEPCVVKGNNLGRLKEPRHYVIPSIVEFIL